MLSLICKQYNICWTYIEYKEERYSSLWKGSFQPINQRCIKLRLSARKKNKEALPLPN